MKNLLYNLVKIWIKAALHLYYGKIKISGHSNIPKNKPVLFLPNHQSALLDVLLLAVDCNRKPYFLTRSDIFKNNTLNSIFDFFRMIPIYRIRDGREALKNNQAVFDKCSNLFKQGEAILMFPEANHNIQRRVRPLSKGFTRILFNTLEKYPEIDIRLVPVGINYRNAEDYPDKVAIYFGENIPVSILFDEKDLQTSILRIKEAVSDKLKQLTTHIEDETTYDEIVTKLDALGVDYLNPKKVNDTIANLDKFEVSPAQNKRLKIGSKILKFIFVLLNFPIVLLWRFFLKPKVWEPEFSGTLRFGFALLTYPVYYILLFVGIASIWNSTFGIASIFGLFVFNWLYVRSN